MRKVLPGFFFEIKRKSGILSPRLQAPEPGGPWRLAPGCAGGSSEVPASGAEAPVQRGLAFAHGGHLS